MQSLLMWMKPKQSRLVKVKQQRGIKDQGSGNSTLKAADEVDVCRAGHGYVETGVFSTPATTGDARD